MPREGPKVDPQPQPRPRRRVSAGAAGLLLLVVGAAAIVAVALGVVPPARNQAPVGIDQAAEPDGPREAAELAARMQQALYAERFAASQDDGWDKFQELLAAYEALASKHNHPPVARTGDPRIVIWPGLIYESPQDPNAYTRLPPEQTAETMRRTLAALDEASAQGDDGVYSRWRPLRDRYRFAIPPQGGPMIEWELPELASSRGLARLGAARLHLAAERGEWPAVADAYEDLLALARAASARPSGLSALVGVAITALAHAELRDAVALLHARAAGRPLDAATLQTLIAAMDRQLPVGSAPGGPSPSAVPAWVLQGERIAAIDSIDAALRKSAPGARAGGLSDFRAKTRSKIDAYYKDAIAIAGLPRADRAARLAALDGRLGGRDLPALALSLVASPVGRTLTAFDQIALDTQATRTLLAILLFEAQTGELPRSLAALVPTHLLAPPSDPWNPDGFVYRPLATPDATGRRFLLYSKGADGLDDGGATDPTGNSGPFADSGRGTDALYTPVPPPARVDQP